MEFHEKLRQLRRGHGLTQEELARRLFVSRTAVSKWESGRGYPSLESLKDIAALFSVSIDALLSGETPEQTAGDGPAGGWVFGAPDVLAVLLLFLPLFGQRDGDGVRGVSLLAHAGLSGYLRLLYAGTLAAISMLGAAELLLGRKGRGKALGACRVCSIALCAAAILLFAASRQPYVTALLFLLFLAKTALFLKGERTSKKGA